MTCALFICGKARMRNPTAADICAYWQGVETDFAGLSNDADERVSSEHIEWADVIFGMERKHKSKLRNLFSAILKETRVISLDIPDNFVYMQPELVQFLETRLRGLL